LRGDYLREKVAHSVFLGAAAALPLTAMLDALQAWASALNLQVTTSHFTWGLDTTHTHLLPSPTVAFPYQP
jgi:hypothetical protein